MGKVRIVTDSSAHFFDPGVIDRYAIQVLPQTVHFAGQTFREGETLDAEMFFRLAVHNTPAATLTSPSAESFAEVYRQLNRETDQILSLHMSHQLGGAWDNARVASRTLLGRCEIIPVDSLTTSVGLAMLVEAAAKAAEDGAEIEEVVRIVRAMLPHIYSVFYVESLGYLRHNGLLSEAQSVLGAMLDVKPFLTIEDGELIPMEKVRTQAQAIDKLVEFVSEFSALEELVIVHNAPYPTERTHQLQDQLAAEFPGRTFPLMMYGPSLATLIGPDGMGVIAHEDPNAEEEA